MKITAAKCLCIVMILPLILSGCSLFSRKAQCSAPPTAEVEETKPNSPETKEPTASPVLGDPTPAELLSSLVDYDFDGKPLTVAVPDDCSLFAEGTDSNAVLAEVLSAITEKYNTSVFFSEYAKNHLYMGVKDMVEKGSATAYFADLLILPATEYARYREADLLQRLETLPFVHVDADCYDKTLTELFSDEEGTFGAVGHGSQLFKNQIVLFFNTELLAAYGIDFDGYSLVDDGLWNTEELLSLIAACGEKTEGYPLTSGLSAEMTADLLAVLGVEADAASLERFGTDGRNDFMMGRAPLFIGVLGDVERMPKARDLYGMLPIPYLTDTGYETFYDMEGVYVFCVPKGVGQSDLVGLFLQAYHSASAYLPYSYFKQWLVEKYVRDENTLRMITLVGKTANYLPKAPISDEPEELPAQPETQD